MYFEIVEATKNGDKINCRIVDDTGIVNAYFDRFGSKLKVGGVFLMTHLKSCLIDSHIRVEMRYILPNSAKRHKLVNNQILLGLKISQMIFQRGSMTYLQQKNKILRSLR